MFIGWLSCDFDTSYSLVIKSLAMSMGLVGISYVVSFSVILEGVSSMLIGMSIYYF